MKMNKRGQSLFIGILVGILIFLNGMLFINFLEPEVNRAQNIDNLDCQQTGGNISDGAKVTCLITEVVEPYFILVIVSIAGGFVTARLAGSKR